MKYTLLEIRTTSPALFHAKNVKSYFLSTEDFIPSQTIRGSIVNALIMGGTDPDKTMDFFVSPAYPVNSAPAHPFVLAVARKSDTLVEVKESLKHVDDGMDKLREEAAKSIPDVMDKDGSKLKPKPGVAVTMEKEESSFYRYSRVKITSVIQGHVAVNKVTMNKEGGMLYHYEYKSPYKFWAISSQVPFQQLEVNIGRSKGRGFGNAVVKKVKDIDLNDNVDGKWAYCLSPCFAEIQEGLGKMTYYTGWFTSKDMRGTKPFIRVASQGSLIKVKEKGLYDLKPAGLNFAFSLDSLGSLLQKVRLNG